VAQLLGVSSQRVHQLLKTQGFPPPVAELSAGRVWDLDQVWAWHQGRRRGPGRPAGRRLGERFLLMDRIGGGGFADVFRAEDLESGEIVAMKILRNWEPEYARRFSRELRLLTSISHPNVVEVLDFGEVDEDELWYAMPLAKGSLEDELNDLGPDDSVNKDILNVVRQIGAGLEYLHGLDSPVFHRDLCPANVLRMSNGDWAISDFGLAREAERRSASTHSSIHWGWAAYAAPEQLQDGLRSAEQPADIYSFGRTLLAMVLGKTLIPQDQAPQHHQLRSVIRRATHLDPSRRYGSIRELVDAVESIITGPAPDWESPDLRAERLHEAMTHRADRTRLEELRSAVMEASDDTEKNRQLLTEAMARMTESHIRTLWMDDPDAFLHMIQFWAENVRTMGFQWSYCDILADFGKRVVTSTADDDVLRLVVTALLELGANHNRWHVRGVVISLLQQIRDPDRAQLALEAVQAADPASADWTLTDFAARSFHPILRKGVVEILE